MTIIEIIKEHYSTLTKKQKDVADYLIEKPADICYISIAGLCDRVNCSAVTILKFCRAIGLPNFIELKKEFRNYNQSLINQFSVSSYDIPKEITSNELKLPYLEAICKDELNIIMNFYKQIDLRNIWDIANCIVKKQVIYLFAHDASKTMAQYLMNRLHILNMNVVLVDLSEMRQVEYVINQMTDRDVAILFSFPNYYYSIVSIAGHIQKKASGIILLTDSLKCPAVPLADHLMVCETRTKIFHNSWILPLVTVNLLTSTLAMVMEE